MIARKNFVSVVGMLLMIAAFSGCGSENPSGAVPVPGESPGRLVEPERAGIFVTATTHYGPLVVRETPEDGVDVIADTKPWSSNWYPISSDVLFAPSERNGGQSTLEKYDQYVKKVTGKNPGAVAFEADPRNFLYRQSDEEGSDGRCHAWSIASVMEPEPVLPKEGVLVNGIRFFARDLKALLIKSYETIDENGVLRFGQRFNGMVGDDPQDIYPDQFHRVLQAELFEKKRPVLMDSWATVELWNKPIWRAVTTIKRDAADSKVMHVQTWVGTAMTETIEDLDQVGLVPKQYGYTYDLFGEPQPDGSLLVKYGTWTGESIKQHPDFVTALPAKGVKVNHQSKNKQLDQALIDEIIAKAKSAAQAATRSSRR